MLNEYTLTFTPITYWTNRKRNSATILFLHPAFTDHTVFDEQVKYFEGRFNIIVLDMVGHGKSIGAGTVAEMTKYIAMLMKEERVEKIHLVGEGLGGVVAQDFANKYPDKIGSLSCIGVFDINHFMEPAMRNNKTVFVTKPSLFASAEKLANENKTAFAATQKGQDEFYKLASTFNKKSYDFIYSAFDVCSVSGDVRRGYPFFVGVGEKDDESMKKAVNEWRERESFRFIEFENAGSIVNLDNPEAFNLAIEYDLKAFVKEEQEAPKPAVTPVVNASETESTGYNPYAKASYAEVQKAPMPQKSVVTPPKPETPSNPNAINKPAQPREQVLTASQRGIVPPDPKQEEKPANAPKQKVKDNLMEL